MNFAKPMNLVETLFGRPLATEEEKAERIGPLKGIPIFGLDALSSAAYGPEAALTLLITLGMAGSRYVWPITIGIVLLLGIVYFSYRQTITAYPRGGGSYTVATENLGQGAGLLAAAALMIDYVLTAAVGISAGVGALVSAAPSLQPHTLSLCLAILILITIINLRGVQETGGIFLLPTYIFIACLLGLIAVGLFKTVAAGGHPVPMVALPKLSGATTAVSAWLLLRTFSSGCTAMTGVEAVSNGFASRLKLGFENSFRFASSRQAAFLGEGAPHGRVAPRTNVPVSSALVTFRALNLFGASCAPTQIRCPLSTKCACQEQSDPLPLSKAEEVESAELVRNFSWIGWLPILVLPVSAIACRPGQHDIRFCVRVRRCSAADGSQVSC